MDLETEIKRLEACKKDTAVLKQKTAELYALLSEYLQEYREKIMLGEVIERGYIPMEYEKRQTLLTHFKQMAETFSFWEVYCEHEMKEAPKRTEKEVLLKELLF